MDDRTVLDESTVPAATRRARGRRRRWWRPRREWLAFIVAVAFGLVAALAAAAVVRGQPAQYQSSAALAIDQLRPLVLSGDAGVVSKLVALRFKYTGYVTTLDFADAVASETGLPAGEVHGAVFAAAAPNSLIIQIGARTHDPQLSEKIAKAAADALVKQVQAEQDAAGIKRPVQVTMKVVTPALGAAKTSPTLKKEVGAAGVAGLVAIAAVLSVAALRSRED